MKDRENVQETTTGEFNAKADHLKFAIEYDEARIRKLNSESSIIIAIEVGIIALITALAKYVISDPCSTKAILGVFGTWSIVVIFLLLQTIRPVKGYFSTRTSASGSMDPLKSFHFIWPKDRVPDPCEFFKRSNFWKTEKYLEDLEATLFTCHRLIFHKMNAYRKAMLLAKFQVVTLAVAIVTILAISSS